LNCHTARRWDLNIKPPISIDYIELPYCQMMRSQHQTNHFHRLYRISILSDDEISTSNHPFP
jgi:hypothetical protein